MGAFKGIKEKECVKWINHSLLCTIYALFFNSEQTALSLSEMGGSEI